jgi:hypothetical protein
MSISAWSLVRIWICLVGWRRLRWWCLLPLHSMMQFLQFSRLQRTLSFPQNGVESTWSCTRMRWNASLGRLKLSTQQLLHGRRDLGGRLCSSLDGSLFWWRPCTFDLNQKLVRLQTCLILLQQCLSLPTRHFTFIQRGVRRPWSRVGIVQHGSRGFQDEASVMPDAPFLRLVFGVQAGQFLSCLGSVG